jgi:transcriptional regulator with XRE-family HTH domain
MPFEVTAAEAEWAPAIRAERARQGLEQTEVAKLAGLNQATVSRAESGRGSEATFRAIAAALGIELPEVAE